MNDVHHLPKDDEHRLIERYRFKVGMYMVGFTSPIFPTVSRLRKLTLHQLLVEDAGAVVKLVAVVAIAAACACTSLLSAMKQLIRL